MSQPDAAPAARLAPGEPAGTAALPALAAFDFPVALVVTDGGRVIARQGPVDRILPFASVTKPLVAWAALVAVERGMLDLSAPVPRGPGGEARLPGATLADLLAHCSGVAADSPAVLAAPGARRIYSNYGIELLGQALVEATATDLQEWVEDTVLQPLGMSTVCVPGSPAHSGQGSAEDLSLLAREMARPTLISPELALRACTVARPGLAGVLPGYGRQSPNDFGLGVEIRGAKSPHWTGTRHSRQTFGHFGQSGSFLWVDPVAGRQAVFLGELPFGKVHRAAWPDLNDQILALPG